MITAWAVSALRKQYEGEIVWAVQERCAPVIATPGLANHVVLADMNAWKKKRWSPATWRAQLATFGRLRRFGFETGLDFQGHSKTAICLRVSGAKNRYASRGTDALAKSLNQVVDCGAGSEHEVLVAERLVSHALGVSGLPELPIMPPVSTGERDYVSIQTGAGHKDKQYPSEQWSTVARLLVREGIRVVVVGAPGDPELGVEGVESQVGKMSLAESIEVVAGSRVHVAADTGTGHIASAYGVPLVSVFGPTDPKIYTPWGPKTTVLRESREPGDVSAEIIVETTMAKWREG